MTTRTMDGPEPLYRLKVVSENTKTNPDYTGYGCGLPTRVPTGGTKTTYYGPYIRRHAAASMKGYYGSGPFILSAEIETCTPSWEGE